MITNAAKHLATLAGLMFVAAFVYVAGDLTFGNPDDPREGYDAVYQSIFAWNPGDLVGFGIFITVFLAACWAVSLVLITRDAEVPAAEDVEVPVVKGSLWPMISALGAGVAVVGLVVDRWVAIAGFGLMALAALEWVSASWTDRYSTDADANTNVRSNLMLPLELPLFAALLIGAPVLLFSRVLLAVSKTGAALLTTAVATVALAVFFVLYVKPELMKVATATVGVLAVVAVLVGGIVAAAIGPRDFEIHVGDHHGEEHDEHDGEEETEEGLGLPVEVQFSGVGGAA